MLEVMLLFGAGVLGGMMNAIAGGGSFITFPALIAAGVPPISANATNTYKMNYFFVADVNIIHK